ncbi:substrate-binding domain-containing protein (plasmid) [Arthrobacter sp. Z1-9]
MVVTACGAGSPDTGSSSGNTKDTEAAKAAAERLEPLLRPVTEIALTESLTATPAAGKVAYLVYPANPTTIGLVEPFNEAVQALGWTPRVIGFESSDPQGAVNGIRQAVQAGADYIVEVLGDIPAIKPGLDVAKAAGVPVVLYSGTGEADAATNGVHGMLGTPEGALATLLPPIDWVIADSEGSASVLMVGLPEAEIVRVSTELAVGHLNETCSNCTVQQLGVSFSQMGAGGLADLVVAELRKHPDIKYVVAALAPAANGLRQALDAAGMNDVQIAVPNITEDQLDGLRDGEYTIGTINGLGEVSWLAADMLARIDLGMEFDLEDYAASPFQTFDRTTIGDVESWTGTKNYEDQYRALWGKN